MRRAKFAAKSPNELIRSQAKAVVRAMLPGIPDVIKQAINERDRRLLEILNPRLAELVPADGTKNVATAVLWHRFKTMIIGRMYGEIASHMNAAKQAKTNLSSRLHYARAEAIQECLQGILSLLPGSPEQSDAA